MVQVVYGKYDFATSGGAIGTFNTGCIVPKNSFILNILTSQIANLTSGGAATIDLGYVRRGDGGAPDASAFASALAYTTFAGAVIGVNTTGDLVNVTAAWELTMTVGTAALTGGNLIFAVMYVPMLR